MYSEVLEKRKQQKPKLQFKAQATTN